MYYIENYPQKFNIALTGVNFALNILKNLDYNINKS